MHLNREEIQTNRYNTLRNFPLQGFNKRIHRFRCSGKREHLNLATRQNSTLKPLTTNALQDFQQLHPRFRSMAGLECRGMQIHPGSASGRGIHQTRNRTAHASEPEQNPRNSPQLIEKLSVARFQQAHSQVQMQWKRGASEPCRKADPAANPLTTNALQEFLQLRPWFRSQPGLEHRRLQMRPEGVSGKGIHQTRNRTAHASEPEQNSKNPLQHIEKLSIVKFQQASPLVQMQQKMGASEPYHKTESGNQTASNKRIARLSTTTPKVQIPDGFGTPQNANVPWRHFWQGFTPNTQQNSTCI